MSNTSRKPRQASQATYPNGASALDVYASEKKLPAAWLREQGLCDLTGGDVGITYRSEDGAELFRRIRRPPGKEPRFLQPPRVPPQPYGLCKLDVARKAGRLFVSEGETDTLTLWHHRLPALGLPGSNTSGCLTEECLSGIDELFLCIHNDDGGKLMLDGVVKRLGALSFRGKVRRVELPPGVKDVNDLYVGDVPGFSSCFRQLIENAVPLLVSPPSNDKTPHHPPCNSGKPQGSEVVSVLSCVIPELYEPFPTDALPPVVRSIVQAGSAALGCDVALIALPALAVCAAAIGNSRAVKLKRSWSEPSILWTSVVGESGTLKTPAYRLAVAPLHDVQRRWLATYKERVKEYRQAKLRWEENGKDGEQPERPVMRRLLCSDVTVEKLAEVLEDNPRGVLITRDELSGWFGSFSRYKGRGSNNSDLPHYLELYSAGNITYDRKGGDRPQVVVYGASASVTGCIQPGILARVLTQEHYDSGLAARLLMAMPPRTAKHWTESDVGEDVGRDYLDLVERLALLEMRHLVGESVPDRLELTPGARAAWVRWYDEWAQEQADSEGEQAARYSKIEAVAARLALVHHVVAEVAAGRDATTKVSPISMECGVRLARWFAREARRIHATLRESTEQRDTRLLCEWLNERGEQGGSARELQRRSPKRYPTSDAAEEALDRLVDAGLACWRDVPSGEKGGRPARRVVLKHSA